MANKNNKYKVYRKYTTDDNGITWVETDEYRIVLVEENSKDCITETPTNTRWVETTGYICANKNKYAKEIKQISTDGGKTWTDTGEYRQGKLIEENSKDCGGTIQYKWVDTGEFECGSNLSSDSTIVDEAPGELTKETLYRWVVAQGAYDYVCDNKVKYYLYVRQQSTDGGLTWSEVQPREVQKGLVMENSSNDCTSGSCNTYVRYTNGNLGNYQIVGTIGCSDIPNCSEVKYIKIGTCVTEIRDEAFVQHSHLREVTIQHSVRRIGNNAFEGCKVLGDLKIGDSVEIIGSGAFGGCDRLGYVNIPNSVKIISDAAFSQCLGLYSIDIGSGVTSIGSDVFFHCHNLSSIIIPNSVISLGNSIFQYCEKLSSIKIPNSLRNIGAYAFYGCDKLLTIDYEGTKKEWNAITKDPKWTEFSSLETIHCIDGNVDL